MSEFLTATSLVSSKEALKNQGFFKELLKLHPDTLLSAQAQHGALLVAVHPKGTWHGGTLGGRSRVFLSIAAFLDQIHAPMLLESKGS